MKTKMLNIGVATKSIASLVKNALINESLENAAKTITQRYLETLKESEILKTEYNTFSNIENKKNIEEQFIGKYIEDNINLFDVFLYEEILKENKKLKPFILENSVDKTKKKLYCAIQSLIYEHIKPVDNVDTDKKFESYKIIYNYLKNNQQ